MVDVAHSEVPAQGHGHGDQDRNASNLATEALPSPSVYIYWFGFIALHTLCFLYFAITAWCYTNLPGTMLDGWLYFFDLGWGSDRYQLVAVVHGCISIVHVVYMLWMIGWSLKKKRLIFAVYNVFTQPAINIQNSPRRITRAFSTVYKALLPWRDLLSVDGQYFDLVLLSREIVETGLQTHQAYRMSRLLPRVQLNRGYVTLLVLNCWSTALIHIIPHKNHQVRRFNLIIMDCILDVVTCVGITSTIMIAYFPDFDFTVSSFPFNKWYEDIWTMYAFSEFQILLVASSGDLVMRMVFALSLLSNMNNMKFILTLRTTPREGNAVCKVTSVLPCHPSVTDLKDSPKPKAAQLAVATENRFSQVLFFTWGVIILALHMYAEFLPALPQCKMQCRPWGVPQTTCALLVLDCYEFGLDGNEQQVIAQWEPVDPVSTIRLVIRHCPRLEMPEMLSEFSNLIALKLYNSTILNWGANAAISQINHPNIMMLYVVRVNMTNGELPPGLSSEVFPPGLIDIEFCITNLRTLPDDFDTKWPKYSSIYFEASEMTEIPPSLVRLAPWDISLAKNPIQSVPAAIFDKGMGYLHIGSTLVSELPKAVANSTPLLQLRIESTNISFFWDWVDALIAREGEAVAHEIENERPISAYESRYCFELERIFSGEQTYFSNSQLGGLSPILSDASKENWETLKRAVSCEPRSEMWYPIGFEDAYSEIR